MSNKIKFNSFQVSDIITQFEKHGVDIDIDSDAAASDMFSDVLFTMVRALDTEQAEIYHNNI